MSRASRGPQLRELDLEAHLRDPARRQRFVTPMFDLIAPRYDAFTRLFSFGMDARWKRTLVTRMAAALRPDSVVLDLASGTGDLAFAAAALAPRGRVLSSDASEGMAAVARQRAEKEGGGVTAVAVAEMGRIPLADASVDVVTAGYGFRNVPDARAALREAARVIRPGGTLLTLDFYRPASAPWRALLLGYLAAAGNLVGWLWHREPVVYGYIARSIDHWMSWQAFSAALEESGFAVVGAERRLLGGVCLHEARRR